MIKRKLLTAVFLGLLLLTTACGGSATQPSATATVAQATTPITHIVVIFQENVSFDHYFGTYPKATNPAGEPTFTAAAGTPTVNGLTSALLTHNPNQANPVLLARSQALTCDQDHAYTDEQIAFDNGKVDKFVQTLNGSKCKDKSIVMDYYDGNTVTALWNYAQHFSLSDTSFGTTFGPSTPGALNLISGQTHGATPANLSQPGYPMVADGTVVNDLDPTLDDCSKGSTATLAGKNIGDLLNAKNVTWGWFEGGFRPTTTNNGKAVCAAAHQNIGGVMVPDYIQHHEPFQYYQSTANPHHLSPTATAMIGKTDQANHQYDLTDFWSAVNAGNMPAVSFLKASAYQDGHAGYSDPLDEQTFLVNTINQLEKAPTWKQTAVVISYDDSDGWYDHAVGPMVNSSTSANDAEGHCGTGQAAGGYTGRCGYGPRLPLLIISPYAKENFVDHTVTDQSSMIRFIEDNWQLGRIGDNSFDEKAGVLTNMFNFSGGGNTNPLTLDPASGEPAS
ncbi:MAG TPA: alkaline phosphatase family protein [Ktedonobacteraceae bacterium]